MKDNHSNSIFSNFIWRFLERFGAQGITFVVSLVLARLLDPEVYGVLALVTVFTVLMEVFLDSGFGLALVQKKDADDLDFSTVFFFNIVFSLVLYLILFLAAPLIAAFYRLPELTALVRVMGLIIVISGVKNIQLAYVSRYMLFKKFFFSTIGGTVGAAVVGIAMAVCGFGVWALVAQILFNNLVGTIILWVTVPWRPQWAFSWKRFQTLFSFGWKLLASSLIATLYGNLHQLIIGKRYTTESLAFYNQGERLPSFLVNNIITAVDSVMLPVMSKQQDEVLRVRELTRRSIQVTAYIMWPLMIGFAVCAEPLVCLVLTEKWFPCVPFLQICCLTYVLNPIHSINLNAVKALGRSDIQLKLEVIKRVIGLAALLVTMWFGPYAMALSALGVSVVSHFINSWPNKKLLNYSCMQQVWDMLPAVLLSMVMGAVVYGVNILNLPDGVMLLIQVPLGVLIYVVGSWLLRLETFHFVLNVVKNFRKDEK